MQFFTTKSRVLRALLPAVLIANLSGAFLPASLSQSASAQCYQPFAHGGFGCIAPPRLLCPGSGVFGCFSPWPAYYGAPRYYSQPIVIDNYADLVVGGPLAADPSQNVAIKRVEQLVPVLKNVKHQDPDAMYQTAETGSVDSVVNNVWKEDEKPSQHNPEMKKSEPKNPDEFESLLNHGLGCIAKNNFNEAVADLTRAIALHPRDSHCYYNRGVANFALKRLDIALPDIEKALALDPELSNAWLMKSMILSDQDKVDEAKQACDKAITKRPDSLPAMCQQALLSLRQNKSKEAIEMCNRILAAHKNNVQCLSLRALAYLNEGEYGSSIADYDRLLQLAPENPEVLLGKANLLIHLHLYRNALPLLTRAITLQPSAQLYDRRALCYISLNELSEAINDYNEALKLDPSARQTYYQRAVANLLLGNGLAAADDANTLLKQIGWEDPLASHVVLIGWLGYKQIHRDADALSLANNAVSKLKHVWPYNLVAYLAGKATAQSVLAGLSKDEDLTLAHAYIGLNLTFSGKAQEAHSHLAWVQQKGTVGTLEHKLALQSLYPVVAAAAKTPIANRWALVVGVSKFANEAISLKYADKDATDFYNFLTTQGGFQKDHVKLLTNENATREKILANLAESWLPRVTSPKDLVLVYVSTHGSPSALDSKGLNYLLAHDTDVGKLYSTGVPVQDLCRLIKERVPAGKVVVLLDACHSGAAIAEGGKDLTRTSTMQNVDPEEVAEKGQLVVCSSEPNQVSWESKSYPNSVFTHHLIAGLSKKTLLSDAFPYIQTQVKAEVERDRHASQNPVLKSRGAVSSLQVIP